MTTIILAVAISSAFAGPRNVQNGDPVGGFRLNDLNERPIDTADWQGRPAVWMFIAPQQASSEQALIDLQKIVDDLPPPGIAAVALTGDADHLFELREFATRNRIRIPIVLDAGRVVYGRIGVIVLPTTLVVAGDGRLAAALPGHDLFFARSLRAHARFLQGKINKDALASELAATQPARDLPRETAEHLTHSAAVLVEHGLLDDAVKELEQAIAADRTYTRAPLDLAIIRMTQNDNAAAEVLVQNVVKQSPNDRRAALVLGILRFRQDKLAEARQSLEAARLLNPDPLTNDYWLGRVYEALGDHQRAQESFRAAAERRLAPADAALARSTAATKPAQHP